MFYFFYILVIAVRPIISTSTGPIFTKFAGLVQLCHDLKLFFRYFRGCRVAAASNFVGKIDLHSTPRSSHDIRYGGTASIRQTGQLLYRAQANK